MICNCNMIREEMCRYYDVPADKPPVIENGGQLEGSPTRDWPSNGARTASSARPRPRTPRSSCRQSGFERARAPQLIRRWCRCHHPRVALGHRRQRPLRLASASKTGGLRRRKADFAGPAQKDVRPFYGMVADAFVPPTRYDPMPKRRPSKRWPAAPPITVDDLRHCRPDPRWTKNGIMFAMHSTSIGPAISIRWLRQAPLPRRHAARRWPTRSRNVMAGQRSACRPKTAA